jgi:gluconolactonase
MGPRLWLAGEHSVSNGYSDALAAAVGPGEPTLLAGGGASEGPVWHPEGYLTFVRFTQSKLVRWDPDGTVTVIREDTGDGNGCTLDRQNRLIMCESGHRSVTRTEPDGTINVIADKWRGKRLNRPNDVVCSSGGTVYFTDPQGRMPLEERELGFSGVFKASPDGTLDLVTDKCGYPNGLAFSPDESILYVALTRKDEHCLEEDARGEICPHRAIRSFRMLSGGKLEDRGIFADMSSAGPGAPDGMKVDVDGRVYCTGPGGIWVFDPSGVRIGVLPVPEQARNLAFGGTGMSTLYITAGDSLYSLDTKVRGIGAF